MYVHVCIFYTFMYVSIHEEREREREERNYFHFGGGHKFHEVRVNDINSENEISY